MKKVLSLLIVFVLAISLFAGCGSKTKETKVTTKKKEVVPEGVKKLRNAKVGDTVNLGLSGFVMIEDAPACDDVFNDNNWIVLAKKADRALVLLKNPNFYMKYCGYEDYNGEIKGTATDYEHSFINAELFPELEKDMKKTEDHIDSWVMNSKIKDRKYFILSKAEVKKYVKKKDRKMNKGNGWWLRCSSKYDKKRGDFCAQVVYNHGGFFKFDVTAEGLFVAVRPAAWIALTKEAR